MDRVELRFGWLLGDDEILGDLAWDVTCVVWNPFDDHPVVELTNVTEEDGGDLPHRSWPDVLDAIRETAIFAAQCKLDRGEVA